MVWGNRIAFNALASYGREIVSLALGLIGARWVLQALGQADFGLYGVVGALITCLAFIKIVLGASTSRFYAFAIGLGDDLRSWFNVSLELHLALAVLVFLIGAPLGFWAIDHWLTIPPERLVACRWAFAFSLVDVAMSFVFLPFVSMFAARQLIAEQTLFEFVASVLRFFVAYAMLRASGDRLILYSAAIVAITVAVGAAQSLFAFGRFEGCRVRFRLWRDVRKIREMLAYAAFRLLGVIGWLVWTQGSVLLVNVWFGARANAAHAVANQVLTHATALAASLVGALVPALTTLAGTGDAERLKRYSLMADKASALLVALPVAPLVCEMDRVLVLWLKDPPTFAAELCVFLLLGYLIGNLTVGHQVALSAQKQIGGWQTTEAVVRMLSFPATWIVYRLGCPLVSIGWVLIAGSIAVSIVRLGFGRARLGTEIKHWFCRCCLPVMGLFGGSMAIGLAVRLLMTPSFLRLCCVVVATALFAMALGWRAALTDDERKAVKSLLLNARRRAHDVI